MLSMKSVLASDPVLALFCICLVSLSVYASFSYPLGVSCSYSLSLYFCESVCFCLCLLPNLCVFLSVSLFLPLSVFLSVCCGLFHCLSALSVCIQPHTHRRGQDAQSPASEKSNLCVNCPDSSPIFFSPQCRNQ